MRKEKAEKDNEGKDKKNQGGEKEEREKKG